MIEEESYLLVISQESYKSLKQKLFLMNKKNDFILLESMLQKNLTQKRSWRKISKEALSTNRGGEGEEILATSEDSWD